MSPQMAKLLIGLTLWSQTLQYDLNNKVRLDTMDSDFRLVWWYSKTSGMIRRKKIALSNIAKNHKKSSFKNEVKQKNCFTSQGVSKN